MFGYLFFVITVLFYLGLAMLTATKPNMAGDNAMGYGLGLFAVGIGFTLFSLALTIVINQKGGFANIGISPVVVFLFWAFMAASTFFCAVFKWEWPSDNNPYPQFLHWVAVNHGQIWIPLLWLIPCVFALNTGLKSTLSPTTLKMLVQLGLAVSALYAGGLLFGYLRDLSQQSMREAAARSEEEDRWHREALDNIASHEPTDSIYSLLNYTSRFQSDDVRQAAIAKLKSRADWEAELLATLKNRNAYREVYVFLDANRVDHPELFAAPLNESLLWLAETIKKDIENSNNLQDWSFDMYNIDHALRAIDEQFTNQGIDFYPTVVNLQNALNTTPPEQFKGVRFTISRAVADWLKKHKK